jgi:sugar lactone lactonase YvrE
MWVASYEGSSVLGYRAGDVRRVVGASGGKTLTLHADVVISGLGPNELAIGPDGKLWVAGYDQNELAAYSPSQLKTSGSPSPAVLIRSHGSSLRNPSGLAFDGNGNLWVTNEGTGAVVGYAPAKLGSSGAPAPLARLRIPGAPLNSQNLAIGPDGRLWVARYGDDRILEFEPSYGSPVPTFARAPQTTLHTGTFTGPIGLAFDGRGRLWTSLANDQSVAAFVPPPPSEKNASPQPVASLSGSAFDQPHSVTFDAEGNLWVTSHNNTILEFDGATLSKRSVTRPDAVIR